MQDPHDLRVWHLAWDLALRVVESLPLGSTRKVPGLRSQAIRAANSVHENLAEGCRAGTRAGFLHFVEIALASLSELGSQLELARDTGIISLGAYLSLHRDMEMVRKMLLSLIRTLKRRIADDEERAPPPPPSRLPPVPRARRTPRPGDGVGGTPGF